MRSIRKEFEKLQQLDKVEIYAEERKTAYGDAIASVFKTRWALVTIERRCKSPPEVSPFRHCTSRRTRNLKIRAFQFSVNSALNVYHGRS